MRNTGTVAGDVSLRLQWDELLDSVWQRRAELATEHFHRFQGGTSTSAHRVESGEILAFTREAFEMLLLQLRGKELPEHLAKIPRNLGMRRARQHVDLDELLQAVRLNFSVLWDALRNSADDDCLRALVHHLSDVNAAVERYVLDVQFAYLQERSRMSHSSRLKTTHSVSRLFTGDLAQPGALPEIAASLGVPEDAVFELVAAVGERIPALRNFLEERREDEIYFDYESDGILLAFRRQFAEGNPHGFPGLQGGYLGHVQGLAEIPRALNAAALLARAAADQTGLLDLDHGWPLLASAYLDANIPDFRARILGGLGALPPNERDRMMETVHAYLETGSLKASADRLYCHRNTVINRLAGFKAATGYDVRVPQEAALVLVAARCPGA